MKVKIFKLKQINLTKEHRNFFEKNGYIVFRNVFSKKEMEVLDESISKFSDTGWHNIMNPDRVEFLISQCYQKFKKFKTLSDKVSFFDEAKKTSDIYRSYLVDKRVKKLLNKLTGKQFVGLMTHVIFKHANTKYAKLAWVPHQDNSYAQMKNSSYVTTNLFIHKCFKENGCLYLYPGTHKFGLLNFKNFFSYSAKTNQNPGNRVDFKMDEKNKIDLELEVGDYLVMNGNLVHGSYSNNSKKYSRHLLSFNYGVKGEKFFPGVTAKREAISV